MDAIWAGAPSCADWESSSEFSSESAPTLRRRFINWRKIGGGGQLPHEPRRGLNAHQATPYLIIAASLSQFDRVFAAARAELIRREAAVLKVFGPLLHDVVAGRLSKDGHLDDQTVGVGGVVSCGAGLVQGQDWRHGEGWIDGFGAQEF